MLIFSSLRPQHQQFVIEYARDWNAAAAYKRSGYRARGHAAEMNASRLRRRPDVAAAVLAVLDALRVAGEQEIAARRLKSTRIRGLGCVLLSLTSVDGDTRSSPNR